MRPTLRCLQALKAAGPGRKNTYGFIGLGRMGSEMAFNLCSKRHALDPTSRFVICDAVPAAAAAFSRDLRERVAGVEVQVASNPAEVIEASATLITMLPSSPQVIEVYASSDGVLSGLSRLGKDAGQTLCIDGTTLDVEVARKVARDVTNTGAEMVDAPVSGGVTGAKAGTLTFLVGGALSSYNLALPTLSHMGARITHVGPSGAGLGAKIVNNLILGAQQLIVGEGMLLGEKLGLDPAILAEVVNNSTGGCWSSRVNNPVKGALKEASPPCERDFEGGFATGLMLKDLRLATELARDKGSPLPLGKAAEIIYADALDKQPEYARKDFSSMYDYLKKSS